MLKHPAKGRMAPVILTQRSKRPRDRSCRGAWRPTPPAPSGRHAGIDPARSRPVRTALGEYHRRAAPNRPPICRNTAPQDRGYSAYLDGGQFAIAARRAGGRIHSITSSARASSIAGISRPSAFAVLRLILSSNLVGRSNGISPGLAPLRILSVSLARRRYMSAWSIE
jgi:hypothetical protein